jgi:hypothetical protein
MVAAGLSFQAALAAGFFGTIVALVFYLIMATLGVDYGIPGQVATRVVYGLRGAKLIPSLLVLVSNPCRRICHRRGARENDRYHLSAGVGERDLWVTAGTRRK